MSRVFPDRIDDLPGAELVKKGMEDLDHGCTTAESLLLMIVAPALERLGIRLPPMPVLTGDAETILYRQLQDEGRGEAYSAYSSLLRTIVNFTRSFGSRVQP